MQSVLGAAVQTVTPSRAAAWLRDTTFEGQRKLRVSHARFLADEMDAGRFRPGTLVEFGVVDGKLYLLNGQHTLAAVVEHDAPVSLIVVRQRAADMAELAKLYNTYDSGLTRTWVDAYAALRLNERYDMVDSEISAFGRAVPFIGGGFGWRPTREARVSRSRELRVMLMELYHHGARRYLDCLKPAEPPIRRALLAAPMFAIGAYTLAHDEERAARFWTLAADDQNLAKTDPPKAATMLAQRVSVRGTQKGQVCLAQSVILAWNAYVQDRAMAKTRLLTQPADIVRVLGTPLADEPLALDDEGGLDAAIESLRAAFPDAPASEHPGALN